MKTQQVIDTAQLMAGDLTRQESIRTEQEIAIKEAKEKLGQSESLYRVGRYDQAREVIEAIPGWRWVWKSNPEYESISVEKKKTIEKIEGQIEQGRKYEDALKVLVGVLAGGIIGVLTYLLLLRVEWISAGWGDGEFFFLILVDGYGGALVAWCSTTGKDPVVGLRNVNMLLRIAVSGLVGLVGGILAIPLLYHLVIFTFLSVLGVFLKEK